MNISEYLLIIVGGFFAGAINTLAGYGSLITLTLYMEVLGLPPNIANGTNRVNVMANAFAGSLGYFQQGKLKIAKVWPILISVLCGAILGVIIATNISDQTFKNVYRVLLVLLAILIFTKPKKWLLKTSIEQKVNWWIGFPIYMLIGFYAGLIQAGAGIFLLAALVLFSKKELMESNAIKMLVIFFYSVIVIYVFHRSGLIDWKSGALLAIMQGLGSYLTARFASKFPNSNVWAYRLLMVVIIMIILKEMYFLIMSLSI